MLTNHMRNLCLPLTKGENSGKGLGRGKGQPGGYLIVLPFREVDLEGGQGEMLAHSPLIVDRLRLQGRALGAVPEGIAVRKDGETLTGANTLPHPIHRTSEAGAGRHWSSGGSSRNLTCMSHPASPSPSLVGQEASQCGIHPPEGLHSLILLATNSSRVGPAYQSFRAHTCQ